MTKRIIKPFPGNLPPTVTMAVEDARKAARLKREREWAQNFSMEELEDMMFSDENWPTACGEFCEVEPDGRCPHGYRSVLLVLGLI